MFNECANQFVERLRPLADGRTELLLRDEIAMETLNVIAKVAIEVEFSVLMIVLCLCVGVCPCMHACD